MIPEEALEEVGRQLEIYASAFSNIGLINREIAALDMQIMQKREELANMEREQSRASDTINGLISDYDDDESKVKVNSLMSEKLGAIVFGGMFE